MPRPPSIPLQLALLGMRRPRATLVVAGLLVGLAGLGLLRLELQLDGAALAPEHDPIVRYDRELRARYGLRDTLVVYLEQTDGSRDGIWNTDTLGTLRDLDRALLALPEVDPRHRMSLVSEPRPAVYPGTLRFRPLLDPWPDDATRMQQLRDDVTAIDLLDGTLIARDSSGVAILIGVPAESSIDRGDLVRRVSDLARSFDSSSVRTHVVGAPAAEALLGQRMLADLIWLVPLALLGVAGVLFLACRRLAGVGIAGLEAGACLVFTFGLMGWCGVPVYLTTAVLPIILVSIGIADELHLLLRYQRELEDVEGDAESDAEVALARTVGGLWRPITITTLTTCVGFLSFLGGSIPPVGTFGIFAATGVAFCWLWSIAVVPACLAALGPARLRRPGGPGRPRLVGLAIRALAGLAANRPEAVLGALAVVTLALGLGAVRLEVQDSWVQGFGESDFRSSTELVDQKLAGTHVLLAEVVFTRRSRPAFHDAERVAALGRFERELAELPGVGDVLGPERQLRAIQRLFLPGQPRGEQLPLRADRMAALVGRLELVRGSDRRRELIHEDAERGVVTLLVPRANYRGTAELLDRVAALAERVLAPVGASVRFGGDLAVSQAMIPAIVSTQLRSLLVALLGAVCCIALLERSIRLGLLALAPTACAVIWMFGGLGLAGIPIGVATSTFSAIVFGIGVDYAVHLLERTRIERSERTQSEPEGDSGAIVRAAEGAGPAIVADALAVSLGFAVLGLSSVPANAALGLVIALALGASALLTLLGLPALLGWQERSS